MRTALSLALLLAFVSVAAGCVDSGEGAAIPPPAQEGSFDETTGAVEGLIVDSSSLPLAGTLVALQPGTALATAGEDGRFAFSNVAPGDYQLLASRLGYESAGTRITVVAGEAAQHTFILREIAIKVPRLEVIGPFQGYMTCRMGTPISSGFCGFPVIPNSVSETVWTDDKLYLLYQLTGEDWQNIVMEARWTPSTFATNPNMMLSLSYTERTTSHWFTDSGSQPSPINLVYIRGEQGPNGQLPDDEPEEPDTNMTLRQWLTTAFGSTEHPVEVAFQLKFEMMASIFYSDDAETGYSAFPDA